MSKIMVTGAGGYVGRHLVAKLLELGHHVQAIGRTLNSGDFPVSSKLQLIEADIFNEPNIYQHAGAPDTCIHLAWSNGFFHNDPCHIANTILHYNFAQQLIDSGLKHFVSIGTMHEIGCYTGAIDENTATHPLNNYGVAKDFLRNAFTLLCESNNVTFQWLRVYYITGDDAHNNSIFRKILEAAKQGKSSFPMNSGEMLYDFIDVRDLAAQIARASTQTAEVGVINCCSGKPISLRSRVEKFAHDHELNITYEYNVFPQRPYDSYATWGDATRIMKIMANSTV